jgi:lactocepin
MRFTRKLLAIIVVLGMVLALVPKTVSAAGPAWPTKADTLKAQADYLKSLEGSSSSTGNTHASGLVIDGFQIPPDVAAMKTFKDGYVRVLVTVPGDTLSAFAKTCGKSVSQMTRYEASAKATIIRNAQDEVIRKAQGKGIKQQEIKRFSVLFNGYSTLIHTSDLGKLAAVAGKNNIHFSRLQTIEDADSDTVIGADQVWTDPGVDGTGAVVGVVDTGIDYTHPDFGGNGTNQGFPTNKVVAGYDFAGDNGDAITNDDRSLIVPDHDPMDTNEHGTHVSGIIAADGVVKGVAPKAKIVIAKISPGSIGSAYTEEIVAAWEYMADPNNIDDGPEGSHPAVQSVNMSFGSIAGFDDPTDPERIAIENAISSGIVATLSAGNSGSSYASPFNYNFYPDYSTLGSPAVTPGAISVASSENSALPYWALTETSAAQDYAFTVSGPTHPNTLGDNNGAGYVYVDCGLGGTSADFPNPMPANAVALIQRGTYNFTAKILNAANAGAVAAIVFNNQAGMLNMAYPDGLTTIPAMFISQADGLVLKAKATPWTGHAVGDGAGRLALLGHSTTVVNPAFDTISSFSSWGATPNLTFKPEVTAPGGNIWSTVPVAQGSYANLSGTSMAAPQVAGAAALIRLAHPTWTVEQVKTALMNTATVLTDPASAALPYSPRLQGAGRINVYDALHNDVTVTSQLNGQAAVALGSVESWNSDPITFPLVLHNTGTGDITYDVAGTIQWVNAGGTATSYAIPGAVFSASPSAVTVPAGGSRTVTVTIDATAVSLSYDYFPFVEGYVTFTPASGVALHVPYMGYLGNWNDFDSSTWAPTLNPLVDLPLRVNSYSANFYGGDLGKTGVTWPEDPTNGWTQMGKTFTGTFDASTIAINPDRSAYGPNGGIENNIWVLRNIENLKVEVRDSSDNLVKLIDDVNGVWKGNYAQYQTKYTWYWSGNAAWQWYGTDADGVKVADGQYYLNTVATPEQVINKPNYDDPQVVSFPVFVDTQDPVVTITGVAPAGVNQTVSWTVADPDPSSGLWGTLVWYSMDGTTWSNKWVGPAVFSTTVPAGAMIEVDALDNAKNTGASTFASGVVDMSSSLPGTVTLGTPTPFVVTVNNYGIDLQNVRYDGTLTVPSTWTAANVTLEYYDAGTASWLPLPLTGGSGTLSFYFGPWTGFTFPAESEITTALRVTLASGIAVGRVDLTLHMDQVDGTGAVTNTIHTLTGTTYAIEEPLTIVQTTNPPDAYVGQYYSIMPSAVGGVPPYTWTVTGLPAGLTYSAATGGVSGTPTVGGVFNPVTFTVHDSGILSFSRAFTLTVHHLDFTNLPASLAANSVFTPAQMTVATSDLPVDAFTITRIQVGGVDYTPRNAPSLTKLDDHTAQFTWSADFTERNKTVVFTVRATSGTYVTERTISVTVSLPSLLVFTNAEGGQVLMIDTDAQKIRAVAGSYDTGWQDLLSLNVIPGVMVYASGAPGSNAYISANLNLMTGSGIVQVIDIAGGANYSYIWRK